MDYTSAKRSNGIVPRTLSLVAITCAVRVIFRCVYTSFLRPGQSPSRIHLCPVLVNAYTIFFLFFILFYDGVAWRLSRRKTVGDHNHAATSLCGFSRITKPFYTQLTLYFFVAAIRFTVKMSTACLHCVYSFITPNRPPTSDSIGHYKYIIPSIKQLSYTHA